MDAQEFRAFVEQRLDEKPGSSGDWDTNPATADNPANNYRYWVSAAGLMVEILLAATPPDMASFVEEKLTKDMRGGDADAASALLIFYNSRALSKKESVKSLADVLTDGEMSVAARGVIPLISLLVGVASADRVATVSDVLAVESEGGHALASVLRVMLATAYRDMSQLVERAVKRAVTDAQQAAVTPTKASTPAKSGGCYIATAVYGSYDAPPVLTLRRFRDEALATSVTGRAFIVIYYAVSPFIAKQFEQVTMLHRCSRRILDVVVRRLGELGYSSDTSQP